MAIGIDLVQPVSQDAHRRIAIGQCLPMGTDIDSIGQSADDEHLRTAVSQIGNEAPDQILPVTRHPTGTDDADDPGLIQVGITFII